jgi:hypothetical protein
VNPYDPSDDELRQWAYSGLDEPIEDFDLMVAEWDRAPLLIELASSPARDFVFRCLYLIVGDAVRTTFHTSSREQIKTMLAGAAPAAATDRGVGRWIGESQRLLEHPERFDFDLWCDGGLAKRRSGGSNRRVASLISAGCRLPQGRRQRRAGPKPGRKRAAMPLQPAGRDRRCGLASPCRDEREPSRARRSRGSSGSAAEILSRPRQSNTIRARLRRRSASDRMRGDSVPISARSRTSAGYFWPLVTSSYVFPEAIGR